MMAHGADLPALVRRASSYVDRILRGAKPSELPIQYPTKFELAVNLKTAKAIGVTIPETFLARAAQADRELAAELAQLESLISALPLAEPAASLDHQLHNAHGVAGRVQVLRRWLACLQRAETMTEAIVGQYIDRAEARAAIPRDDWRPHNAAPWPRRS
jgi:hypothetical protein